MAALRYTAKFAPPPPPWRNPRKGRDQILPSGNLVLRAMNVSKVDYFSLDVEGNEMDVLRSIPFDDLEITVKELEGALW